MLALRQYDNVLPVYCNTLSSEHPDNARFLRDVEQWLDVSVQIIESSEYRDVDDVIDKTRYMSGVRGARCTVEMKKRPRFEFQLPDDIHIFGFTSDESGRIHKFKSDNPELRLRWPLREFRVTKEDCYSILKDAGIALPVMYSLGYPNNNCIGCVKATSAAYWAAIREDFPDVFARRVRQSRALGVRLTRYKGKRIYLDELPANYPRRKIREDLSCGPQCSPP